MSDSHAEHEPHEHSHASAHAHDDSHHSHHDGHEHHDHHDHHDHSHPHEHEGHHGTLGWLLDAIPFLHGHSHGEANVDQVLETSNRGIWALKVSLVGLFLTALFQLTVVLLSGSVSLLADTIHNFSDALTAVPLWIAFTLARRPANRRYTYGYGRAEDIAGVIIVLMIFASSLVAGYESYQKFLHPEPLRYVWWVIAAALIGFVGNEAVAIFRIRIGKEIGSAALVADGQHARVDGLTSLAVLFGALGSLLGFPLADPIIGLLITIAILFIVKDTVVTMWRRLMDAVDPQMVDEVERAALAQAGVMDVHDVRMRWIGHKLHTELHITVDEDLPTLQSHQIAEQVRHALFNAESKFAAVTVHVDPCGHSGIDPHALLAHHSTIALPMSG
ncbi:MAG TPA: cation diffusion facilitator family transporter [Ktedonobacteraceae bacterium]|nr:cation diffusion facilitator family transporter [Ktedonobacteraceae bacterium]